MRCVQSRVAMKTVRISIIIWKTVAVGMGFSHIYETNQIR